MYCEITKPRLNQARIHAARREPGGTHPTPVARVRHPRLVLAVVHRHDAVANAITAVDRVVGPGEGTKRTRMRRLEYPQLVRLRPRRSKVVQPAGRDVSLPALALPLDRETATPCTQLIDRPAKQCIVVIQVDNKTRLHKPPMLQAPD